MLFVVLQAKKFVVAETPQMFARNIAARSQAKALKRACDADVGINAFGRWAVRLEMVMLSRTNWIVMSICCKATAVGNIIRARCESWRQSALSILRWDETHELEQPPFFLGGAPAAFWAVDCCLAIQFARAGVFGWRGEVFEVLRNDFCTDALGQQSDDTNCTGEFADLDGENLSDSDFVCGFEVLAGEFDVAGVARGGGL